MSTFDTITNTNQIEPSQRLVVLIDSSKVEKPYFSFTTENIAGYTLSVLGLMLITHCLYTFVKGLR